ncbi:MAG: hypothetical protein ACRDRX_06815 [Pseudonocardiaceae bacterium]
MPPTAPEYVALEELPGRVMGPDAVKLLGRTVTMTTPGESFFLTGLRGSGKTVQLLRLKRDLRERGFAVVMFSAEDYLNMHEPLNVVDVLFFLVGAISDEAVKDGLIDDDSTTSRGWSRLRQWLAGLPHRVDVTGAEVKATLPVVTATLKAELRRDTAFVAQLREFLRGRLSELVEQANRIVEDLVAEMRDQWSEGEWKGLVVIVARCSCAAVDSRHGDVATAMGGGREMLGELLFRSGRDAAGRALRGMAYHAGLPV